MKRLLLDLYMVTLTLVETQLKFKGCLSHKCYIRFLSDLKSSQEKKPINPPERC